MINNIRTYTDGERLNSAYRMLAEMHELLGIQCQNCIYYKPDPEKDEYKGICKNDQHDTYWSQYCDDFDAAE